jgi:hypothetical protein
VSGSRAGFARMMGDARQASKGCELSAGTAPVAGAGLSSYKWWVVSMLWFVCFFNYADRQSIFSVFPKLKGEFGFDPVQLGLIGSAFMKSADLEMKVRSLTGASG